MTKKIPSFGILYLEPPNWKTDNGNDKLPDVMAIVGDVCTRLTDSAGIWGRNHSASKWGGNGIADSAEKDSQSEILRNRVMQAPTPRRHSLHFGSPRPARTLHGTWRRRHFHSAHALARLLGPGRNNLRSQNSIYHGLVKRFPT